MPQEQQFQGGTFTPITGLVEHSDRPLEVFQKTADVLQQRYWQAKQQYNVLDSTIKNMPMIDKSLDSNIINHANKLISDKINPIIENDDFHKAQGTVIDLTKTVLEDTGIKALSSNYAALQAAKVERDKRYEKEPSLRNGEKFADAMTMTNYRKQGGSVDKLGNSQAIPIFEFQTNMNIEDEAKRVEDLASKMKAWTRDSFGGTVSTMSEAVQRAYANKEIDQDTANALTNSYNEKTTLSEVSANDVHAMAKNIIANSPMFKTKTLEIAQVNHFNNTGRLDINTDDVSKLYNGNSGIEKEYSLMLSPTYQLEKIKLQNSYTENINAGMSIANATKLYNANELKLKSNEAIYKEGQTILHGKINNSLENLYYNVQQSELEQSILHAGDAFIGKSVTHDRNYLADNHLYDLLKEKKLAGVPETVVSLDGMIHPENNLSPLNQDSPEGKQAQLTIEGFAGISNPSKEQIRDYKNAVAQQTLLKNNILYTFNSIPDKSRIGQSWYQSDSQPEGYNESQLQSLATTINLRDPNNPKNKNISTSYDSSSEMRNYNQRRNDIKNLIIKGVSISDLLSLSPNEIINKVNHLSTIERITKNGEKFDVIHSQNRINISTNERLQLIKDINDHIYKISKDVTNSPQGSTMMPLQALHHNGTITHEQNALDAAIYQSIMKGQIKDIQGNLFDPNLEIEGVDKVKGKIGNSNRSAADLKGTSMNTENGFYTYPIESNGSDPSGRRMYGVHVNVLDKDGHKIRDVNKQIYYDEGDEIARRNNVVNMNNEKKSFFSPTNYANAKNAVYTTAGIEGGLIADLHGTNINQHITTLSKLPNGGKGNIDMPGSTITVVKNGNMYDISILPNDNKASTLRFPTNSLTNLGKLLGVRNLMSAGLDSELGYKMIEEIINKDVIQTPKK